jgi:hypothetical protein
MAEGQDYFIILLVLSVLLHFLFPVPGPIARFFQSSGTIRPCPLPHQGEGRVILV